jgi:coenzyme F420-reducing hydrogenase delta subunit/thioredoxin reductase/Pyruvate/2-oxoacid:ferredoxin oxidoreductase delta subunit
MASEEVLIVGGGFAGLSTATALARTGIASTIVDVNSEFGGRLLALKKLYQTQAGPDEVIDELLRDVQDSGRITLLDRTRLVSLSGAAGDFECSLRSEESVSTGSFGAVVLATGSIVQTPEAALPVEKIAEPERKKGSACIVLAAGGASSPVQAQAALDGALNLRNKGAEVTVLYQQMSVSAAGLQKLYDDARAAGVVFGRYEGKPGIEKSNGSFTVEFVADDIAERVRLTCDALYCEGEEKPSPAAAELAAILEIGTDGAGFFQSENVSLYPVSTRRRGIYAVGNCRRPAPLDEVASDVLCATAQIGELFETLRKGPPVQAPVVDAEKCAFCLTCYRACPHRAIGFDYENSAAKILENACFACGTCVGECPARAIKFETSPQTEDVQSTRIAGFFCSHSAAETFRKIREKGLDIPEIDMTEVTCSGSVEVPDILEAFENGAEGVVIAGCHRGSCRSITGSHYAGKRSDRVKAIMEQVGLEPERLEMVYISDIEPEEFARTLQQFGERIGRKGEQE